MKWVRSVAIAALGAAWPSPADAAPPTYTLTLGGRTACVTPSHSGQARAEGGIIEVQSPSPDALGVVLTGAVAANAYLGRPGEASETFHLAQEFDVACSDPKVGRVALTVDSALEGFLRSRYRAGARVKVASARVTPLNWDGAALDVVHPPQCVTGSDGRLCNQHLPPAKARGLPLGRYVLTADFVIAAEAAGLADAHATADFSPSTSLPADWVRTRDPFQGVEKKGFGFALTLTVAADEPDPSAAVAPRSPAVRPVSVTLNPRDPSPLSPVPRESRLDAKGFDRLLKR